MHDTLWNFKLIIQKKLAIKNLVKLLVFKSGVRAEIIKSGEISTYNKIKII